MIIRWELMSAKNHDCGLIDSNPATKIEVDTSSGDDSFVLLQQKNDMSQKKTKDPNIATTLTSQSSKNDREKNKTDRQNKTRR